MKILMSIFEKPPAKYQIKKDGDIENYNFEERAAIREFDGGQPRGTAEFFAHEELAAKKTQRGCFVQKPTRNDPQKMQELKELLGRREKISRQMKTETNEQKKKELLDEWMDLSRQIICVRKGN